MKSHGRLFVISGFSGVGKDTLIGMLLEKHPELFLAPSVLTRRPRDGEVDGVDYIFVKQAVFDQWLKEDRFAESHDHFGTSYGTLKATIEEKLASGATVILNKNVNGGLAIKEQFPQAQLIFLTASPADLRNRIAKRGAETAAATEERLRVAKEEEKFMPKYDFVVPNPEGHPEKALAQLERIIF